MYAGYTGVTLRDKVKTVDIRKELGVNSMQQKVREMRLRWYGLYGACREWKKTTGTADHPGGCTGQNILEIKNSGR